MTQIQEYKEIVSIKKTLPKEVYIRYLERIVKIYIKTNSQILALTGQKGLNSSELKRGLKRGS